MDTKNINTTALAYIGDAVYEVYIREYVMKNGAVHRQTSQRGCQICKRGRTGKGNQKNV